ncbi:MAG: tetratricopeptide repeat protein [Acidobacteriaceae bacterium]|nr:tetratricopeptide repeat protein [Acidobacteriaceae bacterium]MBV9779500.1 tetratricopeptide repeat protein [Acidobacteriaceae bacterium]
MSIKVLRLFLAPAWIFSISMLASPPSISTSDLEEARDRQDLAALEGMISQYQQAAHANSQLPENQYRTALAYSYAAEVAIEGRDKKKAEQLAEAGVEAAKKAVSLNEANSEYHRLLGELCGQVIPANPVFGSLKYGQCARDEINKAIQLDNGLALAYVSRGVGNFYLPPSMGGGVDLALKDFDKAISLDHNLAEAYLWRGIALRKSNRNSEARQALQRAVQLDPNRLWAKQQLEKTPAQ